MNRTNNRISLQPGHLSCKWVSKMKFGKLTEVLKPHMVPPSSIDKCLPCAICHALSVYGTDGLMVIEAKVEACNFHHSLDCYAETSTIL